MNTKELPFLIHKMRYYIPLKIRVRNIKFHLPFSAKVNKKISPFFQSIWPRAILCNHHHHHQAHRLLRQQQLAALLSPTKLFQAVTHLLSLSPPQQPVTSQSRQLPAKTAARAQQRWQTAAAALAAISAVLLAEETQQLLLLLRESCSSCQVVLRPTQWSWAALPMLEAHRIHLSSISNSNSNSSFSNKCMTMMRAAALTTGA